MEANKIKLIEWARKYNHPEYFMYDPVKFPWQYAFDKNDAEISGLLTALISFGNRKQIIKKAQELMGHSSADMVYNIYTHLDEQRENAEGLINNYLNIRYRITLYKYISY